LIHLIYFINAILKIEWSNIVNNNKRSENKNSKSNETRGRGGIREFRSAGDQERDGEEAYRIRGPNRHLPSAEPKPHKGAGATASAHQPTQLMPN
jgi:hypothetical protein